MGYLLDTNVISEFSRVSPRKKVIRWIYETPSIDMYLSVMSIGEIRKGIENLSLGWRGGGISLDSRILWFEDSVIRMFRDNLLIIDRSISEEWGRLMVSRPQRLSIDTLLAATALVHGLTMVTLNEKDFRGIPDLEILNPNRN